MRKYTDAMNLRYDRRLEKLLQQRRSPLTSEAIRETLEKLTERMATNVIFAAAVYPKKEALSSIEMKASMIERADIMLGTDDMRYFPVFTTLDGLKEFKPELKDGEYIYLMDKQDLYDFLTNNQNVAAAVVNPSQDDLLLYRVQLKNLIQVELDNLY